MFERLRGTIKDPAASTGVEAPRQHDYRCCHGCGPIFVNPEYAAAQAALSEFAAKRAQVARAALAAQTGAAAVAQMPTPESAALPLRAPEA